MRYARRLGATLLAALAAASLVFLPPAPASAGEPADLRLEVRQGNLAIQAGGQPATLVFAVTNDGPSKADAFAANVVIPFGDRSVFLASSSPSCNQAGSPTVLSCPVAELEVGQTTVFTLVIGAPPAGTLQPTDAFSAAGQITIDAGGDDPNGANDGSQFTLNLTGAPPGVTQINGTVVDGQSGQPVVGASVTAQDVNGATCLSTTDASGAFNCTPSQPMAGGQVTIEATMAGFQVRRTTVMPQNGQIAGVQLALDPSAASASPSPSPVPTSAAPSPSAPPQAIKSDDGFPWDTVLVILGIVLAFGGLGAVGWWMYKRKDKDSGGPGGGPASLPDLVAAESIMPTMPMRVPNSVLSETTIANRPPFAQSGDATAVWGAPAPDTNWVNRSTEPIQVSGAPGMWSGGDASRASASGDRTAEWPTIDPGSSEADSPASGVPAAFAAAGIPASGIPASGIPASGVSASGVPASGGPSVAPASGVPASGMPVSGAAPVAGRAVAPSDPTTAWPAMGDSNWPGASYAAEAPGVPSGPPAPGSDQSWGTPGRSAYGGPEAGSSYGAPQQGAAQYGGGQHSSQYGGGQYNGGQYGGTDYGSPEPTSAPLAGWDTPPAPMSAPPAAPMSGPPMAGQPMSMQPMSGPPQPFPMSAPPMSGPGGYPGAPGAVPPNPLGPSPAQPTAQWPAQSFPASAPPAQGYAGPAQGYPASAPPVGHYAGHGQPMSGQPMSGPPMGGQSLFGQSMSAPPAAAYPASAPPAGYGPGTPYGNYPSSAPPANYGPPPGQHSWQQPPPAGYPAPGYQPTTPPMSGPPAQGQQYPGAAYPASAPPANGYPGSGYPAADPPGGSAHGGYAPAPPQPEQAPLPPGPAPQQDEPEWSPQQHWPPAHR